MPKQKAALKQGNGSIMLETVKLSELALPNKSPLPNGSGICPTGDPLREAENG